MHSGSRGARWKHSRLHSAIGAGVWRGTPGCGMTDQERQPRPRPV